MTFSPQFAISNHLLNNIKQVYSLVAKINTRQFPQVILFELEKAAQAVSSHASTSIEGNPLPLTEVKRILKSQPKSLKKSEQEVLNYNHAIEFLDRFVEKENHSFSLSLMLKVHRLVMTNLLPRHLVGKLRQQPVIVNNPQTGQVIFLPPDHAQVETQMLDLIKFINSNKNRLDPLILAGIFHKQFVIIHPFIDGNGRTARLLTKVLLAQMGLNTFKLFSFERYYNQNISLYFKMVGELGDYNEIAGQIEFTGWLEYFTAGLINELKRVESLLPATDISPALRLAPHHHKLLEHISQHGYINQETYSKITSRSRASRILDFKKLLEMNLIVRKGQGRATHYVMKES